MTAKYEAASQIKDKNIAFTADDFARFVVVDHFLGLYRRIIGDHRGVD